MSRRYDAIEFTGFHQIGHANPHLKAGGPLQNGARIGRCAAGRLWPFSDLMPGPMPHRPADPCLVSGIFLPVAGKPDSKRSTFIFT